MTSCRSLWECQSSGVRLPLLEVWLLVTKDASSPRLCTKTLLRYPLITKKTLPNGKIIAYNYISFATAFSQMRIKHLDGEFGLSLVWVDREIDC